MDQQQQQRVNSFYRANRPGNLNIADIDETGLMQQQQQQSQLTGGVDISNSMTSTSANTFVNHQPVMLNQSSNGVYPQQSPHYQAQMPIKSQQQQQQSQMAVSSPSYIHSSQSQNNQQMQQGGAINSPATHPHHLPHHHASISLSNQQQTQSQQVLYSPQPYMNSAQSQQSQQYGMSSKNGLIVSNSASAAPTTSGYDQQQMSYTPKYSPSCIATASSAHIVNKHAQYFNFDVNNVYTDNNLNKPGLTASNLAANSHQTQLGISSNTSNSSANQASSVTAAHLISPRYITAQPPPPPPIPQSPSGQHQQQPQSQHAYMFTNYQNMPHTPLSPASALPFSTNPGHVGAGVINSHSVPNSPLIAAKSANTHSTVQPHSVFQFSANHIQSMANASNNPSNNNRFCPPLSAPILTSSGTSAVMVMSNPGGGATTSTQLLNHSYEFQPDNGLLKPESVPALGATGDTTDNEDAGNNGAANLVTSNTFTEHDVDMVDEVLNDMLQKEEEINCQNQNSSGVVTPNTPSTHSLLADENLIGSTDIDPVVVPISSSSQEEKTVIASVSAVKPNKSINNNVASSYSLSNLSEAASVEFELNFANLSTNRKKNNPMIESNVVVGSGVDLNHKNDEQNDGDEDDDDESIDENIMDGSSNMYNENNSNGAFSLDMIKPSKSSNSLIREVLKNPKKTKSNKLKHELLSYDNSMEGFLGSPSSSNHSMINGRDHLANMMSSSSPGGGHGGGQQICPICSKLFTNKSALAKHRLTHSNERKYTCPVCDKAFKRQDHLNGHMLTHQDKKPFSCKAPGCDKSYCDSRSLKRHVESQHQEYLALLACGNQEALNYLPNIGKIKANIGPNIQQEILVTNEGSIPLNPSIESTGDGANPGDNIRPTNTRAKNFFTFEEPKPEKCKICGKGFKNIPALNGHMRLHGGTVKDKTGSVDSKNESFQQNEDSLSNCSNNSSSYQTNTVKQLSFSQVTGKDTEYKQFKPKPRNAQSLDVPNNGGIKYFKKESSRDGYGMAHSPANESTAAGGKMSNMNSFATNNGQITSSHMQQSVNEIISSIYPQEYNKKIKQTSFNGGGDQYGLDFKSSASQQHQSHDQAGSYGYESRHTQFKLPQAPSSHQSTSSSHLNGVISYHKPHAPQTTHLGGGSGGGNFNTTSFHHSNHQSNLEQYMQSTSASHHHYEDNSTIKHDDYYETESDYHGQHHHHQNQIARPKPKYGNSLDSSSSNHNTAFQNERNLAPSATELRRNSPQPPSSNHHLEHSNRQVESKPLDHQDLSSREGNNGNNNMDFKHIYDITLNAAKIILPGMSLEQVSMQAAAATAVAVVSVANQHKQTSNNNFAGTSSSSAAVSPSTSSNKSKLKPGPLFIPSDINAFQNKQLEAASRSQLNPPPFNHSSSYSGISNTNPYHYAGYYPNATLLKSPRLFPNYHEIMCNKKQYTPPPMLSPFRKGPGLIYNPRLMSLILPMMAAAAANAGNNNQDTSHSLPQPTLNHSISYPSNYHYDENNNENYYEPDEEDEPRVVKKPRTSRMDEEINVTVEETTVVNKEDKKLQSQISESGATTSKPSLIRSRLMSQISTCSIASGAFFPADENANETIAAAIADCAEINTAAFINVGDDYQAVLPEKRSEKNKIDQELESTNREDLMISPERLSHCYPFNSSQFNNYLELVCNSSLVYGSSNNLELGLHVLNYFDGDVEKAVKGFLNVSIELPAEHPIRTYKYNETECWSTDEIKKFEAAIIKNDKMFSEIASEVGSKSVKQCVEFYYLWKKVMSEGVRKKWRHVKRTRMNGYDETSDENNKEESGEKARKTSGGSKNDDEENDEENDDASLVDSKRVDSDAIAGSLLATSDSLSKNRGLEFKCLKCNKGFKTKRKLRTHLNSHTTTTTTTNN